MNKNKNKKISSAKIRLFLYALKRVWLVILAITLTGATVGGIITRLVYTPEYEVNQVFTIELKNNPNVNLATSSDKQLSKTIPALLSSDTFSNYMKKYIDESGVKGRFSVTSLDNSNIFTLTAISNSNENAITIINEIQKRYTDIADRIVGESKMKFIAEPGLSALPSNSPHYTIGIAAGGLLALALCLAAIFFNVLITDTICSADDLSEISRSFYLGSVHRIYHKKRSGKEKNDDTKIPLVSDSSTELKFCQDISTISTKSDIKCKSNGYKTIMIASTLSGEGKSSICLNLAIDLASKGKNVLIMDFDLRSPCIAKRLGLKNTGTQLSDAIKKNATEFITQTDIPNLFYAGNTASTSVGFTTLDYKNLSNLLNRLRDGFDYIFIDTPPSDFLSDSAEIGELVDAFIYVISNNTVSKNRVLRTLSGFDTSKCEMLGYVINYT